MEKQTSAITANYKVRIAESAITNIDEITGYIAFINHQPQNAIMVGDALFDAFDRIKKHPFAFKECEHITTKTKMYRQAICLSWYIIYKVVAQQITILGIIHASRKPTKIKALRKVK
jgi:plasmid stabilization system protein ParE